jgi:hypothetical protein
MSFAERLAVHALLLRPDVVRARLDELRAVGVVRASPNDWQIALGVVRMLHRVVFRGETVGTSRTRPIRGSVRARLLRVRAIRAPLLLRERAIAPLDLSGLLSSPDRLVAHLLAAHHDRSQFAYDLEMLSATPAKIREVLVGARAVVERDDARSRYLRDLCVYDGYHERLAAACERALRGDLGLSPDESADPDISFAAYLAWCGRQPSTLEATFALLRVGRYHLMHGVRSSRHEPAPTE